MRARAVACANIALAKYWGKSDTRLNLPAVPSLSLTLAELQTTTTVEFDNVLERDSFVLNGADAPTKATVRATLLLDRVRTLAGTRTRARIESSNNFPTASGLASSASGFAALASAATRAAGLSLSDSDVSALARASSASAARSVFAGFVELPAGSPGDASLSARPFVDASHFDVRMVVAVTAEHEKDVGSTDGMEVSRTTSPYYAAWLHAAPSLFAEVCAGIREKNIVRAGEAMEKSTWAMHACALASSPSIRYFQSATANALDTIRSLRALKNIPVYATMDAGPHVKALCLSADAEVVAKALTETAGVLRTLIASPGPGITVDV